MSLPAKTPATAVSSSAVSRPAAAVSGDARGGAVSLLTDPATSAAGRSAAAALLVNAVKELSQQVKDLKAELEALKNG